MYTLTVTHPFGGQQDWHYPTRDALNLALTFWRNARPCTADGVTGTYTMTVTAPAGCPRCFGRGMYRKDESSWFACDCEDSVMNKHDSHSDQDIDLYEEWHDPDAHERLRRDEDLAGHEESFDPADSWPGVHPLEGSPLDACAACGDTGWIAGWPSLYDDPANTGERCTCPAGEPVGTYPGAPSTEPPFIPHTDEEWLLDVTF